MSAYNVAREWYISSLELSDPVQHISVVISAEVVVGVGRVPGIEGVVAYDVETLGGQSARVADEDPVQVLVVAV